MRNNQSFAEPISSAEDEVMSDKKRKRSPKAQKKNRGSIEEQMHVAN